MRNFCLNESERIRKSLLTHFGYKEMFFNDIISCSTIFPSLLTDIEYIGCEIDLLLKYGVCNKNDSSVIFKLIEKYTTKL